MVYQNSGTVAKQHNCTTGKQKKGRLKPGYQDTNTSRQFDNQTIKGINIFVYFI
jgi:hypothetical protein